MPPPSLPLLDQFGFGCSHTTRDPREGEEEGVHYHFTSLESMREGITRGDFIEHAEVKHVFILAI